MLAFNGRVGSVGSTGSVAWPFAELSRKKKNCEAVEYPESHGTVVETQRISFMA